MESTIELPETNLSKTGIFSNEPNLILLNDDHNTFDYVIETLIKVCNFDICQAEQITIMAHFKGKAPIKSGSFEMLTPYRDAIKLRGIGCKIEL